MNIYILLLITVLFCCLIESTVSTVSFSRIKINTRKLSFWVCFFFILFIGLFRNELLGVDVANYKEYFNSWYERYNFVFLLRHFELDNGYIFLNKIVKVFSQEFYIFKCVLYFICVSLFSIIIYKRSKYPALSFLIYLGLGYLGTNFCLLRQAAAYSICFVAFIYLKQNKLIKFILLIILAATFHKTALFFALVYPLTKDIFKSHSIIKKGILVMTFMGFSTFIIPNLFQYYKNDYSQIAEQGQGFNLLMVYCVILFIMSRMKKKNNKESMLSYEASFCSIYFQIGALFFSLFTRVTNFYALLFTIAIPELIDTEKNKKLYIAIFAGGFSLLYLYSLFTDSCQIVPYLTNFN